MNHKTIDQMIIKEFTWLVDIFEYTLTVAPDPKIWYLKTLIYTQSNSEIRFVCDCREQFFDFEIFWVENGRCYSITEYLGSKKMKYHKQQIFLVIYESVFQYTRGSFTEQDFQSEKNDWLVSHQLERVVQLYSRLIKEAVMRLKKYQAK